MPVDYSNVATTQPASTQPVAATRPTAPINLSLWWKTFDDPILNNLIDRAVSANLDLQVAIARLRQARAQYGVVYAGLFPEVDATGNITRQRVSPNGPALIDVPRTVTEPTAGGGTKQVPTHFSPTYSLFQAGFDSTWEMDVFGGQKRDVESAEADIQAADEDVRDALVSLLAETARNYIEYRALQRRLALVYQDINTEQQTVEVTRARFKAGLTSDLDVARAEAQVKTTAAELPQFRGELEASLQTLAVTLGTTSDTIRAELTDTKPIPIGPPNVPVGLPSELLRRRPDVRAAERRIASASAQIGVATAELFPNFSLTGTLGFQSTHFKSWFNAHSGYWSIGPSVNWPVLDWGRIKSNIHVQEAITQQNLLIYQKTVLQAISDVETSLNNYANERDRRNQLADAVNAQQRALDLANQLYKQGVGEFLDVLDAQRSLFLAQDTLAQSDQAVSSDLVSLYKALGGGWE